MLKYFMNLLFIKYLRNIIKLFNFDCVRNFIRLFNFVCVVCKIIKCKWYLWVNVWVYIFWIVVNIFLKFFLVLSNSVLISVV